MLMSYESSKSTVLALVAMWLLRCMYTRYCICDTVLPCWAHVHIMFTTIQFLRARAKTFIQFLRANCMFIVSKEAVG